jgi:signal transduction histidine kinase
MKRTLRIATGMLIGTLLTGGAVVRGEGEKTPEALAKESEAACQATATTKATPALIMEKVNEACKLLEKEGKGALPKFKGKESAFIFAGTYIWIHDMDCVMVMHPVKYKMEGQSYIGLQDINGKKFFIEMNELCKTKGAGWVDYMWPKPGEKAPTLKVSYVKKTTCDGKEVVVGCGVYDMTMEEVQKSAGK